MQGGLLLESSWTPPVVTWDSLTILLLVPRKSQVLPIRWDCLLALGFGFDSLHGIMGLDLEGNGLAGSCKDLHLFLLLEENEWDYASEILLLEGLHEAVLMGKPCSE